MLLRNRYSVDSLVASRQMKLARATSDLWVVVPVTTLPASLLIESPTPSFSVSADWPIESMVWLLG